MGILTCDFFKKIRYAMNVYLYLCVYFIYSVYFYMHLFQQSSIVTWSMVHVAQRIGLRTYKGVSLSSCLRVKEHVFVPHV